MLSLVDLWVLASAGLAITWVKCPQNENQASQSAADKLISFCWWIHSMNQILPAVFLVLAASSPAQLLQAAVFVDFDRTSKIFFSNEEPSGGYNVAERPPAWFEDAGFFNYLCLHVSLLIWRAEKLESLIQRIQRSVGVAKMEGAQQCLSKGLNNPKAYAFDPVWGSVRRVALIAISSFGYVPFVHTIYATVVLDESLGWLTGKVVDFCERSVVSLPMWVSIVLIPVLDQLHFIPVIIQVFLLGLTIYPYYTSPGVHSNVLTLSAIAWTAHNCNVSYHAILVEIPESARQLWEALRAQG